MQANNSDLPTTMTDTQIQQQILDAVTRVEARQASDHAALMRIEGKQDFLIGALAEGEQQADLLDTGPDSRPLEPSDPK